MKRGTAGARLAEERLRGGWDDGSTAPGASPRASRSRRIEAALA